MSEAKDEHKEGTIQKHFGYRESSHLKKLLQDDVQIQQNKLDNSEYEVNDIEQKEILNQGYTFNLIIAIIQGLIGPFIFGYSISCINLPSAIIQQSMGLNDNDTLFRLLNSLLFIGGFVGSILGAKIGDYIGRKRAFIVNDFIFMTSSIIGYLSGMTFVKESEIYNSNMFIGQCISRFLLGVAACLGATITPVYLGEISPPLIRGQVGTLNPLFITFGIVFAALLGYENVLGNEQLWPYLLLIYGCMPVLQLLTVWSFPESPIWLLKRNKQTKARNVLAMLRQKKKVSIDLNIIKKAIETSNVSDASTKKDGNISINGNTQQSSSISSKRGISFAALISIVLMGTQQFSGINMLFLYSTKTLNDAGINDALQVWIGTLIIYSANSVSVLIAASLVDKLGRKMLIYISLIGMIIGFILISIAQIFQDDSNSDSSLSQIWGYIVIFSMIIIVIAFEIGIGPVPWLLSAEISSSSHRGMITGLNTFVNQSGMWFVSFFGPKIVESDAEYFPFVGILLFGMIFTKLYVPETKGKDEIQIQKEMNNIKLC